MEDAPGAPGVALFSGCSGRADWAAGRRRSGQRTCAAASAACSSAAALAASAWASAVSAPLARSFWACGGQGGLCARDNKDLLKLVEVSGRPKLDERVGLVVRVGRNGFDRAHGQAARINLVAARSEDLLAGLNAGIRGQVVDQNVASRAPTQDRTDCGSWQEQHPRQRSGR